MLASTRSCLLLVLTAFAVLLLKSLQAGRRHGPLIPHSSLKSLEIERCESRLGNESDAKGADTGVQITGYWKEVRAGLGLTQLSDVILVPSETDPQFDARGSIDEGEGMRLQRLGRLIPGLRRREVAFTSPPHSWSMESQSRARGDENKPRSKHTERDGQFQTTILQHEHMDSPSIRTRINDFVNPEVDEGSVDDELPSNTQPYSSPDPELFIAPDADSRPRTPVSALAASFRAIAQRELKVRYRSRAHIGDTRSENIRRGDRSRR